MAADITGAAFDATLATLNEAGEVVAYAGKPVTGSVKTVVKNAAGAPINLLNAADKASVGLAHMAADITGAAFDTTLAQLNEAGEVVAYAGKPVEGGIKLAAATTIGTLNAMDSASEGLAKGTAGIAGAAAGGIATNLREAGQVVGAVGSVAGGVGSLAAGTLSKTLYTLDKGTESLAKMSAELTGAAFDATLTTVNEMGEVVAYAGKPVGGAVKLTGTAAKRATKMATIDLLGAADRMSVGMAQMAAEVTGAAFDASLVTLNDAGEIVKYSGKPVGGAFKMTASTLNALDKSTVALAGMAAAVTGAGYDATLATVNDLGEITMYAGKPVAKVGYGGIKVAANTTVNSFVLANESAELLAKMSATVTGKAFDASLATLDASGNVVIYAGRNAAQLGYMGLSATAGATVSTLNAIDSASVGLANMSAAVNGAAFDATLATVNDLGEITMYAGKPVAAVGYGGIKATVATAVGTVNLMDEASVGLAKLSAEATGAAFDASLATLDASGNVVAYAGKNTAQLGYTGLKVTASTTIGTLNAMDKPSEALASMSAAVTGAVFDAAMATVNDLGEITMYAGKPLANTAYGGLKLTANTTVSSLKAANGMAEEVAEMSMKVTGAAFDASLATLDANLNVVTYAGKNVGKLGYSGLKMTTNAATVGTLHALDSSSEYFAGMGADVLGATFDATLATLNEAGEVVAYAGKPVAGGIKLTGKTTKKLGKMATIDALQSLDAGSERLALYSAELAGATFDATQQTLADVGQIGGAAANLGVGSMKLAGKATVSSLGAMDKASEGLSKMAADVTGAAFDSSLATLNDAGAVVAYAGKPVKGSIKLAGATALNAMDAIDKGSEGLAHIAALTTGKAFDASLASLNASGVVVGYAGRPVAGGIKLGINTTTGIAFGTLAALDKGSEALAQQTAMLVGASLDTTIQQLQEAGAVVGAVGAVGVGAVAYVGSGVVGTLNAADYASEMGGKGVAMAVGGTAGLAMKGTAGALRAGKKDPNRMSKKELKVWKEEEAERRTQAALDAETVEEEVQAQVAAANFAADQAKLESEAIVQAAKDEVARAKESVKTGKKVKGPSGGEENPLGAGWDNEMDDDRTYTKKELKAMQKDIEERAKEATAKAKKMAEEAKDAADAQSQALVEAKARTKAAAKTAKEKIKVPPPKAEPEGPDEHEMTEEEKANMLNGGGFDWGDEPEEPVDQISMEIEGALGENYSNMKEKQLIKLCKERNLSEKGKKPELIARLEIDDYKMLKEADVDEETADEYPDYMDFESMKLGALKKECKERGLETKGKKADYLERLAADEDAKVDAWEAKRAEDEAARRNRKKRAAKAGLSKFGIGAGKAVLAPITGTAGAAGSAAGGVGKVGMGAGKGVMKGGKMVGKGAKGTKDVLTSDEAKMVAGGVGAGMKGTKKGIGMAGKGVSGAGGMVGDGLGLVGSGVGSAAGAMSASSQKERKENKKAAALARKRGHTGMTGQLVGGLNRIDGMTESAANATGSVVGGTLKGVGMTAKGVKGTVAVAGTLTKGTLNAADYASEKAAQAAALTVGGSVYVAGKSTKLAVKGTGAAVVGTLDAADSVSVAAANAAAGTVAYTHVIGSELANASAMAAGSVVRDASGAVISTASGVGSVAAGVANAADGASVMVGGAAAGAIGATAGVAGNALDATAGNAARGTGKMAGKGAKKAGNMAGKGAMKGAKGSGKLGLKGLKGLSRDVLQEFDAEGNPIAKRKKLEGWEDEEGHANSGGVANPLSADWADDEVEIGYGSDVSISSEEEMDIDKPMSKRAKLAATRKKATSKATALKDGGKKTAAKHEKRKREAFLDEHVTNNQTKILIIPDYGGTHLIRKKFNAKKAEHEETVVWPSAAGGGGMPGLGVLDARKFFASSEGIDLPPWQGQGPFGSGRAYQAESEDVVIGEIIQKKYKGLISWATGTVGEDNVATFPYDWRREYGETTDKLVEYMAATSKKFDGQPLQVVAHGDGGLIAYAALTLETRHLFESMIFIGTAFGPSLNEPLQMLHQEYPGKGDKVKQLLRPKIATTFPSSYAKFPSPADKEAWKNVGYAQDMETGEQIEENWFDLKTWEKYSVGPWAYGEVEKEQRRHVENCLEAARQFRMRVKYNIRLNYPPTVCLMGDAEKTLATVKIQAPTESAHAEFVFSQDGSKGKYDFPWLFGDGRVPCDHAVPARGTTHIVQMVSREHDDLVNENKALSAASETIYASVTSKKIVAAKHKKKDNKRDEKRMEEEENRQHALWLKFELKPTDVLSVLDTIESEMGTHDEEEPPAWVDIDVVVSGAGGEYGMETVSNPMFGDIDVHAVADQDMRDDVRDKMHGLLAEEHGGKKMRSGQQNVATRLNAQSAGNIDSMLGMMREAETGGKKYKVLAVAQLRETIARDSEKTIHLNMGEIHTSIEEEHDGEGIRIHFKGGWTSEYSSTGVRMVGEVGVADEGMKFMGRDGAWGTRHSKEGKRVGKSDAHEEIVFDL